MELKLGSVWLLLSCSLQQSLWGILASVPQTSAKKCTHKISDSAEVRKVQMLKRIPARCSGWDEAWSWLSQKDCRTKYKMDYVELPRAVQKVDDKDCEPADSESAASESGNYFNVSDEKFLAIAFGSATVALLILILIIIVALVRRGQICIRCCTSPSYTTANAAERDSTDENQHGCNAYVEEGLKLMESEYEEIMDPSTKEKKLALQDDVRGNRYQNLPLYPNEELKSMEASKLSTSNGTTVVPSAPYEEDLHQTNTNKSVPNNYSAFFSSDGNSARAMHDSGESVSRFTPVGKDLVEGNSSQQCDNITDKLDSNSFQMNEIKSDGNEDTCVQNSRDVKDELVTKDTKKSSDDINKDKRKRSKDENKEESKKPQNEYSEFDDLINPKNGVSGVEDTGSFTDYEEPLSAPLSTHSYENLDPSTQEPNQNATIYDSLAQSPVYYEPENINTTGSDNSPLPSHVTKTDSLSGHVTKTGSPAQGHVTENGSPVEDLVTVNGVIHADDAEDGSKFSHLKQDINSVEVKDSVSNNSSDVKANS